MYTTNPSNATYNMIITELMDTTEDRVGTEPTGLMDATYAANATDYMETTEATDFRDPKNIVDDTNHTGI